MVQRHEHWVVRLDWRNRSVSFALLFCVLGTHLLYLRAGALMWGLLALHMLVSPQIAYWLARRSREQVRAEMRNLLVDALLFGAWVAVWGFPLWVTFMLFAAACMNLMIYRGLAGLRDAVAAMALGVVLAMLATGPAFRPATSMTTTLLCMLVFSIYLLILAYGAHQRGVNLRTSRKQLRTQLTEITSLQAQLQDQAVRDPLTGLSNRRHLDQVLERKLARSRERELPLSLVLIDIDDFKDINDTHGHLAGDEMIKAMARLLLLNARPRDLVCRYGGEEFLLLLSETSIAQAYELAEALRLAFEELRVDYDGVSMRATLSFGVSAFPEHAGDPTCLVQMADRALYAAKLKGRNRGELSAQPMHAATSAFG